MNPEEAHKEVSHAKESASFKIRVRLEPDLESEVATLRPHERRRMARKLYRWAKQLWLSADIIERDENKPVAQFKPLPRSKLARN